VLGVVIVACSSGTGKTSPTTTSGPPTRPSAKLEICTLEYSNGTPLIIAAGSPSQQAGGQSCATLVKRAGEQSSSPTKETVLFDRRHKDCYVLGPVVLTGADIDSASVAYDSGATQWVVVVHWSNDDFVTKVAQPLVNKQIAIVINGAVHSSPTLYPGITGREVQITSGYTRAEARSFCERLRKARPDATRTEENCGRG